MHVLLRVDQRLKQNHKDVLLPAHPQKTIPIRERTRTDIEPQDYLLTEYPVSKKLINLFRHGSLLREDDGAIEFWRIKDYLQNHFVQSRRSSDERSKSTELFKVIQDAILLIFHYRTMS